MPKTLRTKTANRTGGCAQTAYRQNPAGWAALIPPMKDIESYVSAVNAMPMLSFEQEQADGIASSQHGDEQAKGRLIMSHLRLVVSMAREQNAYGIPFEDLIQEGNIGLIKAVKNFDPARGLRLSTYAMHWIHAEITDHVLRNVRSVRMATTKPHRKIFFNLHALKHKFRSRNGGSSTSGPLSLAEINEVARLLNVKPEEVREMEVRLSGGDMAIEAREHEDNSGANFFTETLQDESQTMDFKLQARENDWLSQEGIKQALEALDERSRGIVSARWLRVEDDGRGGATLNELAQEYGVSAERIRQIEARALKTMRHAIEKAMKKTFLPA